MWKVTITEISDVDLSGNMYVVFDVTLNSTGVMLYPGVRVEGQADTIITKGREVVAEMKRKYTERSKLKVGDTFLI